ncbi:MAG: hypothetical protein IT229_10710 [Flavobacteriales bacterium]|nr:hypothetical protein [Flavobacteriales bacterium]
MRQLIHLLFLLASSSYAQQWSQLPSLPGAARDDGSSFSIGSDIYVGTGMDAGFQLTTDWHRYSLWDQAWHPAGSLPSTARQYATGFSIDGVGYLQGGVDVIGALNQLWAYEPASNVWSPRAPLPGTARSASASFVLDGLGYVCGGVLQGGSATAQVWAYDPTTNAWVARAPLPGVARHRAMAFTANGKGYVIGGADAQYQALSDGWCYDPVTNTWTAIAPLPQPRFSSDAAEVLGGGVVIGGASTTTQAHADCWVYRASADVWETLPAFDPGIRRGGCVESWGGIRVFYGTGSDNSQRFNDWYVLEVPVGEVEHAAPARLAVFPQPAMDHVQVRWLAESRPRSMLVMDMSGRVVLRPEVSIDGTFPVSDLAPGRYTLVAESADQRLTAPMMKVPSE